MKDDETKLKEQQALDPVSVLGREHLGKRIICTEGDNDAIRTMCVRRISPNGKWAFSWGEGVNDEEPRWIRCETIMVLEVLGPADMYERDIKSKLYDQIRLAHCTSA